ncbi:MAG: hypothetical protein WA064_03400 [Candidatus Moraniibacteriota bacterium]
MKNTLTKEQIVGERSDALNKVVESIAELPSGSFNQLRRKTKLSKVRLIQATSLLWATGGLERIDPKTNKIEIIKKKKNVNDYFRELKKLAMSSKDKYENDAEYLFTTIDLLPGSTFKELRVLTGLDEHNLCVATMWLCENDRIFIEEAEAGDYDSEDEMYFPAGIFDRK